MDFDAKLLELDDLCEERREACWESENHHYALNSEWIAGIDEAIADTSSQLERHVHQEKMSMQPIHLLFEPEGNRWYESKKYHPVFMNTPIDLIQFTYRYRQEEEQASCRSVKIVKYQASCEEGFYKEIYTLQYMDGAGSLVVDSSDCRLLIRKWKEQYILETEWITYY